LDLSQGFLLQKNPGLSDIFFPEGIVDFGEAEFPQIFGSDFMLIPIPQQEMEYLFGANFGLSKYFP
jgi:hypothetical protein